MNVISRRSNDMSDIALQAEIIMGILSGNYTKTIMELNLKGIGNDDIKPIFRIDIFRRRIIEYILEFSFIKDYNLQIFLDKRSYNRIIENLEGFFKNDYITEKDYRWIIDEIECRMNKIESKQNKMSQLFRHIFCKQYI